MPHARCLKNSVNNAEKSIFLRFSGLHLCLPELHDSIPRRSTVVFLKIDTPTSRQLAEASRYNYNPDTGLFAAWDRGQFRQIPSKEFFDRGEK
jgi:hypothetical protein